MIGCGEKAEDAIHHRQGYGPRNKLALAMVGVINLTAFPAASGSRVVAGVQFLEILVR